MSDDDVGDRYLNSSSSGSSSAVSSVAVGIHPSAGVIVLEFPVSCRQQPTYHRPLWPDITPTRQSYTDPVQRCSSGSYDNTFHKHSPGGSRFYGTRK